MVEDLFTSILNTISRTFHARSSVAIIYPHTIMPNGNKRQTSATCDEFALAGGD